MKTRKMALSVPPSFIEVEEMARYYAKARGIPLSAFVWEAVEHYLRELLGEEELPSESISELDRIEQNMEGGLPFVERSKMSWEVRISKDAVQYLSRIEEKPFRGGM